MHVVNGSKTYSSIAAVLKQGLEAIAFSEGNNEPAHCDVAVQVGIELLKTISESKCRTPRAAYEIGRAYYERGMKALVNTKLSATTRLIHAHDAFHDAIPYVLTAAQMPDYQKNLIPARAKEMMAVLHDDGILRDNALVSHHLLKDVGNCDCDFDTAIKWRRIAADEGLVDAMWNLGLMHYRGEGTEKSLPQAYRYLCKAYDNKAHLTYSQEAELLCRIDLVVQDMYGHPTAPKAGSTHRPARGHHLRLLPSIR